MAWIKRNLFFFIGLVLAVLLVAAAGFYDFKSWQANQEAFASLTEVYTTLQQDNDYWTKLPQGKPAPGNGKVDNIQIARDQTAQLREWLARARDNFQPIQPIPNLPNGQISDEMFAPALSQTVRELQREAQEASVNLPTDNYYFSFAAQSDKAGFDDTTLGQVAQQLGNVKTIVEILYGARINELESVQRVPVSKDDLNATAADYLSNQQQTTGNSAVLMPYRVTFRGFSSDIANVLAALASSRRGFVVRAVSVEPASATTTMPTENNNYDNMTAAERREAYIHPNAYRNNPAAPALNPTMPEPVVTVGGMQTVLTEQMLRVSLDIDVVRLTPNS